MGTADAPALPSEAQRRTSCAGEPEPAATDRSPQGKPEPARRAGTLCGWRSGGGGCDAAADRFTSAAFPTGKLVALPAEVGWHSRAPQCPHEPTGI